MNAPGHGSITELFCQLRDGDSSSASELWKRYFPRLLSLARRVLAGKELPVGAEDAVQTAFFHFVQRIERGQIDGDVHRDEIWKLLSMMTAQRARKQQRSEQTAKRGSGTTKRECDLAPFDAASPRLEELFGSLAPPESDLICEELINCLPNDLREVAVLRLSGYTNREIKDILGYPLRSIERRVQLIRMLWTHHVTQ